MAGARSIFLRSPTAWALFAALAAEFLLFDQVAARHHSWIYPRWNDQVQYLTECYTGWEFLKARGFLPGLWQTLVNPSAQGTLHDFAGVIAFAVAGGPSRSALLALNMLALVAWQAVWFYCVIRNTRSRALAWAAAALPLMLGWPWNGWAGSMADFRLDHFAMCAFGITFGCAQLTDGFRSRRWSLVFGAAVGVTLLTRFLTGTYFALVYLGLGAGAICRPERPRRVGNLALSALVAFALAAPVFWLNREWVWNYYWIGHFTGPESAIRSPHMNFGRSLEFIWSNFRDRHLGSAFWQAAGLATALWGLLAAIAWWTSRPLPSEQRTESGRIEVPPCASDSAMARASVRDWAIVAGIFALAPAIILTLHSQKSEIVLGVIAPGFVGLVVAAWWGLFQFAANRPSAVILGRLRILPAIIVCLIAALYFSRVIRAASHDAAHSADMRAINQIADRVFVAATAAKLPRPWVGANQISTGLDALVLSVICYERHHVWMPFAMTLPTGIMEADEKLIMERVALSDFFFMVVDGPVSDWPFDRQQRALVPKVRAWCDLHRRAVASYEVFDHRMVLYQRREIP